MIDSTNHYSVEIDNISKELWEKNLLRFNDATIHQTWSMGKHSFGEKNLSHLVLKKDSEIIAMAQVSIKKLPLLRVGGARLFWGPLWQRKGEIIDYTVFERIIEALKDEYIIKRGLLLRVWPFALKQSGEEIIYIMCKHGFMRNSADQTYRTIMLDITPPMEILRRNLTSKWRNHLNAAEKNKLTLMIGADDMLLTCFFNMLQEMLSRKNFETHVNYSLYRQIQNDLPEDLKLKIFVCHCENMPIAAGVFSAIGDTGEYLFGATANNGLKLNGANLIQWEAIKWLKEKECKWYDLGGIDPHGNPGVYHFKSGVAGKSGLDGMFLGQFYLSYNSISYFLYSCINIISNMRRRLPTGLKLFS